jgi:hypothetical protein
MPLLLWQSFNHWHHMPTSSVGTTKVTPWMHKSNWGDSKNLWNLYHHHYLSTQSLPQLKACSSPGAKYLIAPPWCWPMCHDFLACGSISFPNRISSIHPLTETWLYIKNLAIMKFKYSLSLILSCFISILPACS